MHVHFENEYSCWFNGFFSSASSFFCFKLDLEEGVSNMMAVSKNGEYVIKLST